MKSTFWEAFDNADEAGEATIKAIASILFDRWKDEIRELTDLVMVINHKCWAHYRDGDEKLSGIYGDLYYEYYEKAINYMESKNKNEEISYFVRTLD